MRRMTRVVLCLAALTAVIAATASTATAATGVMAWGDNAQGELGDGTTRHSTVPLTLAVPVEVTQVSGGDEFSLALLSNGTVEAWGGNAGGELGNGTFEGSKTPVLVKGLSEVAEVSAGEFHGLARLKNGTVVAWGANPTGDLGNGTTTSSNEFVAVEGLKEVVAVAAGVESSFALLASGEVMAWGSNLGGRLGTGSSSGPETCVVKEGKKSHSIGCALKPVKISGISEATAISAGGSGAMALLAGGTVETWGLNDLGELGNGSETGPEKCPVVEEGIEFKIPCSQSPVAVSGLSEVTAIAAGGAHSLALLSNHTVKAWGDNQQGQVGDGSTSGPETCKEPLVEEEKVEENSLPCSRTPVAVSGLSEVASISGGAVFSLALLKTGRVRSWGRGSNGELANGSTHGPEECPEFLGASIVFKVGCSRTPVAVLEMTQEPVAQIAAGAFHGLAIGPPGPVVSNVSPVTGSPAGGETVKITGAHLAGASSVKFGANSATILTDTETEITVTSPAGAAGTVHVVVTTPSGTIPNSSLTSVVSRYSYVKSAAPELGRCVKVAKGAGKFSNAVCTTEKAEGSYEWVPGTVKSHFTLAGAETATLETVTKTKITCTAQSGSGEYNGTKEVANVVLKLTGCVLGTQKCTSSGATVGEVVTNGLEGSLGWQEFETSSAALDLQATGGGGPIASFICGGTVVAIQGSVVVPVKANKMVESTTLKFAQSKGKQKPEQLEGEPIDVLETSFFGGGFEQTGLGVTLTQTNEEAVEINAVV
jgi:alpha-tubulin suppressor-like RCC1 family protein